LGDRLSPPMEVPTPKAFLDDQSTGVQVAKEQGNRTAVASGLAKYFADNGITSDQIDALKKADPDAHNLFWNNAGRAAVELGISKQPHYVPSPDTIDRTMAILRTAKIAPASDSAVADAVVSPPKSATMQHIREYAGEKGLAEDVARKEFEDAGYQIADDVPKKAAQ
jgi:hypothetical protein